MVDSFADIFQKLFTRGFTYITSQLFELLDSLLGGVNGGFSSSWENPIVQVFLSIANTFSWVIFIVSSIFFLLKIVQEQNRDWYTIFKCPITVIIFIATNQLIVRACLLIPDMFISGISSAIGDIKPSGIITQFKALGMGYSIVLVTIIAFVIFLYLTFVRFGAMLIQMMIAPLYVPYVTTGDNQKVSEWILSTVSIGFTYMIQYLLFYGGFILLSYSTDVASQIISFSLIFSTFKVSAQMQKFGYSSGGGGGLQSAYMGANMISSLIMRK